MTRVSARAFYALYTVISVDMMNFGIIFPILPSVAKSFGQQATGVGILATTFSLAQLLCTPLWGKLSDNKGRRQVLLVSIIGMIASSLLTAVAWDFQVVIVARILNGMMGGTAGVVNAYIADVTSTGERPAYMSYVWAASSIGLLAGPVIGSAALAYSGPSLAFVAAAALSSINLCLCLCWLPESRQLADEGLAPVIVDAERPDIMGPSHHAAKRSALSCRPACVYSARFLVDCGMASFETIVGYYMMDKFFHGDPIASGECFGWLFIAAGLVMLVISGPIYHRLYSLLGLRITLVLGSSLRTFGWVAMPLGHSAWLFSACFLANAAGSSIVFPTMSTALSHLVSENEIGQAFSYYEGAGSLARIFGPMVAGHLYAAGSRDLPFYIVGLASLVSLAFMLLSQVSSLSKQ